MEKLEIIKENVASIYKTGDESHKELIKKLWPGIKKFVIWNIVR